LKTKNIFIFLFKFQVDKNGDVCISILHEPGDDKYGYEKGKQFEKCEFYPNDDKQLENILKEILILT
jgi:ubiquitin-protein ligase